jgi:error-prone DNA polymerase
MVLGMTVQRFSIAKPSSTRTTKLPQFCELDAISNFSFLQGASHPEELVQEAITLGYCGIGIADIHSMAGCVRAYHSGQKQNFPCFSGTRIHPLRTLEVPSERLPYYIIIYPTSRSGYAALTLLLTIGKRRAERDGCVLTLDDIAMHALDWVIIIANHPPTWPPAPPIELCKSLGWLKEQFQQSPVYLSINRNYGQHAEHHSSLLIKAAKECFIPIIASNRALYHQQERKLLCDILTCIRNNTTLYEAGMLLTQNSEHYLKPRALLAHLYRDIPIALKNTLHIAEQLKGFSLAELVYEYPAEVTPEDYSAHSYLSKHTWAGAHIRYPQGIPTKVCKLIEDELAIIRELDYDRYFLTCYDIVAFARSKGILCQGRGSAANSIVCYCLGITSVSPEQISMLFARFISRERNEPPDIDIDFEHERREEVIQYIYDKYGRHRAALTAAVITFRRRSALREVSKAMGYPSESIDALATLMHRWRSGHIPPDALLELGFNPQDPHLQRVLFFTEALLTFPRHLTQHVGGFIISDPPLCHLVPIRNTAMESRTIIEWDKDDIDALGILKIDILALGMLTCIRKAFELLNHERSLSNEPGLALYSVPPEDPSVYDMICMADTIGVFQIESRAQMSMLPRLKPRCFYDLVIEVAIVRPGPIQGNMVHPFLRRRNGEEKVCFPDEVVGEILGKTLGVPLFQEQAMRLAIVLAGFTPGEAEQLRKAMAAWKRNKEAIADFQKRIIAGMMAKGYTLQFAQHCLQQIQGFSEYGFPESHAASFAHLVYASCWLKHHHPAIFTTALLNSQPLGFYSPSQLIRDAEQHGVKVLPISHTKSSWDCTLDYNHSSENFTSKTPAIRLGFRLIKGVSEQQIDAYCDVRRSAQPLCTITALWQVAQQHSSKLIRATLQAIAQADGFYELGISRRQALWQIKELPSAYLPLAPSRAKALPPLPVMTAQQELFSDYEVTSLSLRGHPFDQLRTTLAEQGVKTSVELRRLGQTSRKVTAAGIVLFRQRPPTAKGVVFITLEDETGMVNLIIPPKIFEQSPTMVITSPALIASGRLQCIGPVVYVTVERLAQVGELRAQKHLPIDRRYG